MQSEEFYRSRFTAGEPATRTAQDHSRKDGATLGRTRVALTSLGVITLAGGVVRFTLLGRQSYWEDEVVTVQLLHEHLWSMLRYGIPQSENTPPLYYLLGWVWIRVVGSGPVAVRSLSALFGTATIPVAYYAARRLTNGLGGLVAAALVAASPVLVWYSQEARVYSLFVFLSAMSFLFFVRALQSHRERDLAGWSICSAIALTAHYFAAFLIVLEAAYLIYRLRQWRPLAKALTPIAAVQILLLPLIEKQRSSGTADFIGNTALSTRLDQVGEWFTTADYRATAAIAIAGLLITFAVLGLFFSKRSQLTRGGLLALGLGAGTVALPLLLVGIGLDYFFFRNILLAWVPLAIAVGAGFAATRIGLAAAVALCAVFLATDIAVFRDANLQRDNWRATAAIVTAKSGREAIAVYPAWDTQPLSYYAPQLSTLPKHPVTVQSLWFVGVSSRFSGWKTPASLSLRIPPGFKLISVRHFQHFILRRYIATGSDTITATQLDRLVVDANGAYIPRTQGLLKG
jgi:predicted membrane-bound mannosyltransferase